MKKKNSINSLNRKIVFLMLISFFLMSNFGFIPILIAHGQSYTNISVTIAHDMINNNTGYPDLFILDVRDVGEFNVN